MRARTRRGNLQTAVDTYRRGDRTIVLVGTIHAADRDYFLDLTRLVDDHEARGYDIQFEAIRPIPADSDATDEERALAARLKTISSFGLLAEFAGLAGQYDVLPPRRHWTPTDIDRLTMIRGLRDPAEFADTLEQMRDMLVELDDLPPVIVPAFRRIIRAVLRNLPRIAHVQDAIARRRGDRDPVHMFTDGVVTAGRDRAAADGALNADGDVVALWGAAHIPGIAAHLTAAGFRLESTTWTTAIRAPRPRVAVPAAVLAAAAAVYLARRVAR